MIELDYNPQQYKTLVIEALENPDYHFRTIKGLSRELSIDEDIVEKILESEDLEDKVIQCSTTDDDGQILYTTREHYKKTQPLINKILTAISEEIK